jgi:hypothetical protein
MTDWRTFLSAASANCPSPLEIVPTQRPYWFLPFFTTPQEWIIFLFWPALNVEYYAAFSGSSHLCLLMAIPITMAAVFLLLSIVLCSIFLLATSRTRVGRRKTNPFLVISGFGIFLIYLVQLSYVWWWPGPLLTLPVYYIGFALLFSPLVIRSWRVIALHCATPNFPVLCQIKPCNIAFLSINQVTNLRKRANKWMIKRLVIMLLPQLLIVILLPFAGGYLADFLWTISDSIILSLHTIITIWLLVIRRRIHLRELEETNILVVTSTLSISYFVADNIGWWVFLRWDSKYIVIHVVVSMWILTLIAVALLWVPALQIGWSLCKDCERQSDQSDEERSSWENSLWNNEISGNINPLYRQQTQWQEGLTAEETKGASQPTSDQDAEVESTL